MKFDFWKKRCIMPMLLPAAAVVTVGLALLLHANSRVATCAERVYSELEQLPPNEYGLLLGTAKIVRGKYFNQYFRKRIEAAARLYHAGKVKKLILSGDNRRKGYNEPEDMRQALLEAGVKDGDMLLDYAGFRTLDSVIRARNVFKAARYTVISQQFHCERAVFLARSHQLEVIGFAAREVSRRYRIKRFFREPLARLLAYIDTVILNRQPHFPH